MLCILNCGDRLFNQYFMQNLNKFISTDTSNNWFFTIIEKISIILILIEFFQSPCSTAKHVNIKFERFFA